MGYARVSTREQAHGMGSQEDALWSNGAEVIFRDVGLSSRTAVRPGWQACRAELSRGDTLLVWRLDRLAGTTDMAIEVVQSLDRDGVQLRSLCEPEIDTTTPMGRALLGVVAVFAQLRVDTIRENTKLGLAAARAQGRVGGRPRVMTSDRVAEAVRLRGEGMSLDRIAGTLGVSRATVSRALQRALS